jgi:hydroxymethylpyrimidine pyrophosphatase-like HAD family hydrolase
VSLSARKLPLTRVIAVDVDDTLVTKGIIDDDLVEWCRKKKAEGFYMILWSQRGQFHARCMAHYAEVVDIFDTIIGKPGYIVDDQGWSWTKFTRRITKWGQSKGN